MRGAPRDDQAVCKQCLVRFGRQPATGTSSSCRDCWELRRGAAHGMPPEAGARTAYVQCVGGREAALCLRYVQYGGPTCQHRAPPTSCLAPRTRRTRGCPAVCGRPPSAAAARPGRAPSSPPPGALGGGAALSAAPGRSRPAKRLAAVVSNCQQLRESGRHHTHRARVFSI